MHHFTAKIYKTGINAAVDVPKDITDAMQPVKGYIRITCTINGHAFRQTLVPVKDAPYRLFVNIPMLEGGEAAVGDIARFEIEQDFTPVENDYEMNEVLLAELKRHKLEEVFEALTPSRRKDILKYLAYLKS
ncbi:YdeI/OmpD-associated family protein [uncultured Flavobacterium sp.]|uniref:YdeI/OmpD-associated family protein n=1 Tax=uncultured Flavobacterium sp. TaxID=165435 RepID=UPI0025D48FC3|nr:YdeI/OmpD-associated family protein [uncultured Flavobacterium sp.]